MYTNQEVDKVERKDVIQRFQNKLALQNISSHLASNARESSPIGRPVRARSPKTRSPKKKDRNGF